jgi:hypothetical protein
MAFFSLSFISVMSGSNGIPSPSVSSSKGGFLIHLRPPFTCCPPSHALAPIIMRINTLLLVYTFQTLTKLFLRVFLPNQLNVLPVLHLHEAVPISQCLIIIMPA